MTSSTDPRDAARGKAQKYFTQSEQRDTLVKQEIEKERAAFDARTAKLRALRLAKEAAEKADAAKENAGEAGAPTKPKRARRRA